MARVVAIFDDLLLGSKVLELLGAAGHDVTLGDVAAAQDSDVAVIDLGSAGFDGVALAGELPVAKLGIYPHVAPEVRKRAEAAGFELVVPRSRFMREGAALVDRLVAL